VCRSVCRLVLLGREASRTLRGEEEGSGDLGERIKVNCDCGRTECVGRRQ
jgi:hypothetical protein